MNIQKIFRPNFLPFVPLCTGILGFALRLILLRTQVDEAGLLAAAHPLSILLYVLAALTVAVVALCALPLRDDPQRRRRMFRPSLAKTVGCAFGALGGLTAGAQQLFIQQDVLTILAAVFSLAAAASFLLIGYARQKGTRPHYLTHTFIVIFLMLLLVCRYRIWSPEPQLDLYFFPLMASVFLMLGAYRALCLDIQKLDRRLYVFFTQAALFFCCVSVTDTLWPFYLGMGVYSATNLCTLRIYRED